MSVGKDEQVGEGGTVALPGADASVQPGSVLAGKYRIDRILGAGGMGVVVAATHIHLGQRVAIKFLLPQMLQVPEAAARFAREARNAVRIQNEHVARVSDVGTLESGAPYMVMEYLQGSDLSQVIRERGSLPIADAVDYVLQATVAVAEAHALGIVHRDLKPSNLFLADRSDGTAIVKVLDFGISKSTVGESDAALTKTSGMMGSPLYMAPEQMRAARSVDGRADIWALGVILYELIAGHSPFNGETLPQICAAVLSAAAPPTSRPDVPPGLEGVISRCLEKDPEARYSDVVEFASALLPFADKRSYAEVERASRLFAAHGVRSSVVDVPSPPSSREAAPRAQAAAGTVGSWSDTHAPATSRSGLRAAAIVVVVVCAGGSAWMLLHALRAHAPVAAAAPRPPAASSAEPAASVIDAAPAAPAAAAPTVSPFATSSAPEVTVASAVAPKARRPVDHVVKAFPVERPLANRARSKPVPLAVSRKSPPKKSPPAPQDVAAPASKPAPPAPAVKDPLQIQLQ